MRSDAGLTWWLCAGVASSVLLLLTVAIYRSVFDPLSGFPGPRLAAITRYFEGYYDVIQNGQYTHKIAQFHKRYGPIVRISPYELHVNDADFFNTLYSREGRWNKYDWAYDAHSIPLSTLAAIDHDVHKRRRSAMNPFFSKTSVAGRQEIVKGLVSRLCHRLDRLASQEVKLAAALGAFSRDVATEFLLGKSFDNLGADDFRAGVGNTLQESGAIWRVTKFVRWFGPMIQAMPLSLVKKMGDPGIIECLGFMKDMEKTTKDIHSAWAKPNANRDSSTVVDAILNSDLPAIEKTAHRLKDEVVSVAGAAFETTAYTLSKTLYHVYNNPNILHRLREELRTAGMTGKDFDLPGLEKLPYLTSVLKEGLRLSPAIATRMARVTPDRPLEYKGWEIPPGTPVGMTLLLVHTDPILYPDPLSFQPERWLGQDGKVKRPYAPFGQGTRMCLGMHLAWAELYFAVASLVTRFDFDFNADALGDVTWASDQFSIGTETRNGLKAVVRRVDP